MFRCEYTWVVETSSCPRSSCISLIPAPSCSRWVAKLCLRLWVETFLLIPAQRTRGRWILGNAPSCVISISKGEIPSRNEGRLSEIALIFFGLVSPRNLRVIWMFEGFTHLTSASAFFKARFNVRSFLPSSKKFTSEPRAQITYGFLMRLLRRYTYFPFSHAEG